MSDKNNEEGKTNILPELDKLLAEMPERPSGTSPLLARREVLLVVGDKVERVLLADNVHCLMGRFSQTKPSAEAVDLSPYNAQEHGVSRIHAQLHIEDNHLYLSDLDSTNGTFIGSERLNPHKPTEVHNGDNIRLGRLNMQVLFR